MIIVIGLSAQAETPQQAQVPQATASLSSLASPTTAGLLAPITVQNLLTLAAMSQQPLTNAANQPSPLHNAPTSLCKCIKHTFWPFILNYSRLLSTLLRVGSSCRTISWWTGVSIGCNSAISFVTIHFTVRCITLNQSHDGSGSRECGWEASRGSRRL